MPPIASSPRATNRNSPCGQCRKAVSASNRALACDVCESWIHIRCDATIPLELYLALMKYNSPAIQYQCPKCLNTRRNSICYKQLSVTKATQTCITLVSTKTQTDTTHSRSCHAQTKPTQTCVNLISTKIQTDTAHSKSCHVQTVSRNKASSKSLGTQTTKHRHTQNANQQNINVSDNGERAGTSVSEPRMHLSQGVNPTCGELPNTTHGKPQKAHRPCSVIAFNLPECTSASLATREAEDSKAFRLQCAALKVTTGKPQRLVRISWKRNQTRPLRIDLSDYNEAEKLIVTSASQKRSDINQVRICTDLSWEERQLRKQAWQNNPTGGMREKSVIVHGIPEEIDLPTQSRILCDCDQWQFLREKLELTYSEAAACQIQRLPRPAHLSHIQAPRLLRVTLVNKHMAENILRSWERNRLTLPRDIRIHSDRPREERRQSQRPHLNTQPNVVLSNLGVTSSPVPKNFSRPTVTSANTRNN